MKLARRKFWKFYLSNNANWKEGLRVNVIGKWVKRIT